MCLIFNNLPILHFECLTFNISIYECIICDCMLCFRSFCTEVKMFLEQSSEVVKSIFLMDNFPLSLRIKGDSSKMLI